MIRFSAFLVVVAVGLLIAGVVTSKLLLVYIAIGVSGAALLALGIGAAVNWRELTGKPKTAAAETSEQGPVAQPAGSAPAPQAPAPQVVPSLAASQPKPPVTAAAGVAPAGSGWPATAPSGPSRAGYLPTEQPLRAQPPRAPSPFQPAAAAQPAAAQLAAAQAAARSAPARRPPARRPPAAFTRPQAPAPATPAQPAGTPVPSRGEDAAGSPMAAERKQPEKDQPPASDQDAADQPSSSVASAVAEAPASPRADQPEPANQAKQPDQAKPPAEPEPAGPGPNLEVTVVPGVPRYHNAQCMLIRFMGEKDLEMMTLGAAREIGCTPCRACLPDQPDKAPE